MCFIEKVTAIGRVTAIGYRPAIGCDIYIPSFNSASRSGPRLPDVPGAELVLLPQGRRLVFSPTSKRATKKKETRKRGRKNISFRADCKFRGPKKRFLNQKVFAGPFLCAFFDHVEASTSPNCKLGFALCLYLDKLSLCRATPRRFWLSKTDLKTPL